jgi:hypothetical protein
MKNSDHAKESAPASADAALRRAMQGALAQSDSDGLEDLQGRVLAQWEMRSIPALATGDAAGGTLRWGFTRRDFQLLAAGLVVLVAVGWQVLHMQSEAPMDDLLEPDVLSLMAMGEL